MTHFQTMWKEAEADPKKWGCACSLSPLFRRLLKLLAGIAIFCANVLTRERSRKVLASDKRTAGDQQQLFYPFVLEGCGILA